MVNKPRFFDQIGGMVIDFSRYHGRIRTELRKLCSAIDLRFDPAYGCLGPPVPAQKTDLGSAILVTVPFIKAPGSRGEGPSAYAHPVSRNAVRAGNAPFKAFMIKT